MHMYIEKQIEVDNLNQKTQKITFGAMITALFTILLLIDRQTGSMFQGIMIFVLPIPMVAYGARFGLRSSLAVWAASTLMALFFSLPTTLVYASAMAFIGMTLGSRIYSRKDMTRTLLLVMLLSILVELVNTFFLAAIAGTSIDQSVQEMQTMMTQALDMAEKYAGAGAQNAASMDLLQQMMTPDFLKRILLVSVAFSGAVQGFIIYELSLLILRRLHVAVPQPKPIVEYYPPKALGFLALLAFFGYNYTFAKPMENALMQSLLQIVGIVGYIILMCFGAIAISLLIRIFLTRAKLLNGVLTAMSLFMLPQLLLILGIFYISGSLHDYIARRLGSTGEEDRTTHAGAATQNRDRSRTATQRIDRSRTRQAGVASPSPNAGDHRLSDRARLVHAPDDAADIIDLSPEEATDVRE